MVRSRYLVAKCPGRSYRGAVEVGGRSTFLVTFFFFRGGYKDQNGNRGQDPCVL